MRKLINIACFLIIGLQCYAENGYDLWLRYVPIADKQLQATYRQQVSAIYFGNNTPTLQVAQQELSTALQGLLQIKIPLSTSIQKSGTIVAGQLSTLPQGLVAGANASMKNLGPEGYLIATKNIDNKKIILITGNSDQAVLYGVFHFLRLIQTNQAISHLDIVSSPRIKLRLLNHWDNLNRTVERGYAGFSLWNWHLLPGYLDKRYTDYARACASVGINGTVLTNVNANGTILTEPYLQKVAALANVFRPYGIKVFLTARFSAPVEIGKLPTADPLNTDVRAWWKKKAAEIYALIPDFGGFLVKANSEGQPGPQNYGRTHADGANMLAEAVAPHKGIVMWRAFVYSNEIPEDRHKQSYNEFVPLDGKFNDNVLVQVKNGAIDFQPREPFHPLFGAMPKTKLAMEFQLTQEYLGQATHLAYLAPLFKECLESDTYCKGKGTTVAQVIDGHAFGQSLTVMAGVTNIGNDINWTAHPFAQANWYAFGRLAWDYGLPSDAIADEWLRMTFTNDAAFLAKIKPMMLRSREILVRYMTPIGLHHLMGTGHHYGPAPWINNLQRADWNPAYYHKADSAGIGFDRTAKGSDATSQYATELVREWSDPASTPEKYLLWFHHLPWTYRVKSGRTIWEELCYQYNSGVDSVRLMEKTWAGIQSKIDRERFEQVTMLLKIQEDEAVWWRNACLLYFSQQSGLPIPSQYEKADKSLDYYKSLRFPYAPGN